MKQNLSSAILCPNCRKLINADERACPYCGIKSPGSSLKSLAGKLTGGNIVSYIIYLNVFMYVLSLLLNPSGMGISANPLRFLSPSDGSLLLLGASGTIPIDNYGRWWTLLSANYLHGGILHIFFNMVIIKQLSPLALREFGASRMIIIYTLGGTGGYLVSYLAGVPFTIGASAAVCALIGAILYYGKSRGGEYGQTIYKDMSRWIIMLAIFGFLVQGINNWGHGGGIVSGIVIAYLTGYKEKRAETQAHRTVSTICIIATVATLLWAIASGFIVAFS